MIIHKKRIRNVTPYIKHIPDGKQIVIGISSLTRFTAQLRRIGFSGDFKVGQTILPADLGPISRYNSEGKEIVHRDQPMETVYRQAEWHWEEFHGPYETVKRSKIVDIPYERYPRTAVPPPSVEMTITQNVAGEQLLVAPALVKDATNSEQLIHIVNLFLEIFGECQFFTENLETIVKTPIVRLNWDIFPQGQVPWGQLEKHVKPIVNNAPEGNHTILMNRLETINRMKPDFIAVGKGGFYGYIVHGFTEKHIFILESMFYGNATYVFGETWETLSQRTKAEIINEKLQKARVIHREGWEEKIEEIVERGD